MDEAEQIVAYWKKEFDRRLDIDRMREHLKEIRYWEARFKREDPMAVFDLWT